MQQEKKRANSSGENKNVTKPKFLVTLFLLCVPLIPYLCHREIKNNAFKSK